MAVAFRRVFSRLVGSTATSRAAKRFPVSVQSIKTRYISTGEIRRAGVNPEDESVFTPDHVEMREVSQHSLFSRQIILYQFYRLSISSLREKSTRL